MCLGTWRQLLLSCCSVCGVVGRGLRELPESNPAEKFLLMDSRFEPFFYFHPSSRITGSSFITVLCCLKDVSQERNSKKDSWTISSGAQVHQEVDKVGKGFMTCFTKSTHQQCLCWEVPITIPDAGITLAWLNEPSIICYRIMVWGEHQAQQFIFIAQPPVCSSRSS